MGVAALPRRRSGHPSTGGMDYRKRLEIELAKKVPADFAFMTDSNVGI